MKYIFLDNFRGFSKSTVPLRDVNFLVGENSTGKTSLLTMLRTMSDPRWFMGGYAFMRVGSPEESVQFGHFNELVSAHAEDRSFFRLGVVETINTKKPQDVEFQATLLTYKEKGGLAKIDRATFSSGEREVSLRFKDDRVFFRKINVAKATSIEEMNIRLLSWVDQRADEADSGWTDIGLPKGFPQQDVPIFILLSLAASREKGDKQGQFALPQANSPLVWIAPIRSNPRRTYDEPHTIYSPEGAHTPYVIRRMLSSEKEAAKFAKFMGDVGRNSGLFEKIDIKYFGSASEMTPFEVDAYIDGTALSLGWMGYGVSQSLPIFVELLDRPPGSAFAIQQPEVHLHPRAQASLGDVFFEMAVRENKSFLVETHSDFAIDRFRMNYRRKMTAKERKNIPDSQVLFFERRDSHNIVTPIKISERGDLPADQPESYSRFFIMEEMRLIGLS